MKHVKEWKFEESLEPLNVNVQDDNINWEVVESSIKELWQITENLKTTRKIDGKVLSLVMQKILTKLESALD